MRLLIVRHGESLGNVNRQMQGFEDPLTERGRTQARAIGARLARENGIARLYASPLARAWETAQIIGQATGLTPEPRPGLAEIDIGSAAGMAIDEWVAQHPELAARWKSEGLDFQWPGGESGRQLGERVAGDIEQIMAAHNSDETVVIVSHGGALAWLIGHLLGEPRDRWPDVVLDNCSLTEIVVDRAAGNVDVRCRNDVGHLSIDPAAEAAVG